MKAFVKTNRSLNKRFPIFTKSPVLDILQGFEYAFEKDK